MTIYCGIDPGLDGAICVILPDSSVRFADTPTIETKSGGRKRRQYLVGQMVHLLTPWAGGETQVALEQVGSRPGQGVTSMFNFGVGYGLWQGILAGLGVPVTMVVPTVWKKALGVNGDKGQSVVRAQQLFPQAAEHLTLVKHHGRAEALLIAQWLRQKHENLV